MPAKMVRIYTSARSMMSAGVFVHTSTRRVIATVTMVSTVAKATDSQTVLAV